MTLAGNTSMGGSRRDFPSTCWSRIEGGFPAGDPEARRRAAEDLARRYWKPIYAYVRASWRKSNEEAKDLTQEFFLWMIESDFLAQADPSRGLFRGFVKIALKHFLMNAERGARRQKRGGDREVLSFDGVPETDATLDLVDPKGRTPEEVLDEVWKNELLLRGLDLLETALKDEGRVAALAIFQDYFVSPAGGLNLREVGERHGVAETEAASQLRTARRRFREILSGLVAETVSGPEELAAELAALFGEEPAP